MAIPGLVEAEEPPAFPRHGPNSFYGYFSPLGFSFSHARYRYRYQPPTGGEDRSLSETTKSVGVHALVLAVGAWVGERFAMAAQSQFSFQEKHQAPQRSSFMSPYPMFGGDVQVLAAWFPGHRSTSIQLGAGYGQFFGMGVDDGQYPFDVDVPGPFRGPVGHVGAGYSWGTEEGAGSGVFARVRIPEPLGH